MTDFLDEQVKKIDEKFAPSNRDELYKKLQEAKKDFDAKYKKYKKDYAPIKANFQSGKMELNQFLHKVRELARDQLEAFDLVQKIESDIHWNESYK